MPRAGRARCVRRSTPFFHARPNQYDRGSQTANAMPLVLGLVPRGTARGRAGQPRPATSAAGGNRVTAGDVGFHYVVQALSDGGRGDVLYDMVMPDDGPGYVYQLKQRRHDA